MAVQIKDIKDSLKSRLETRERLHTPFLAEIVSVHGSIYAKNRPDYVWIAENAQPESRHIVYKGFVSPYQGLKVWVQKSPKPPHGLEIIGIYNSGADPGTTTIPFTIAQHAQNHQYPSETNIGIDPVKIFQPAIYPFKTIANGSDLTVLTYPYIFNYLGVTYNFNGAYTDMTAYMPGIGNDVRVLIYMDLATQTLSYLSGTEVTSGNPAGYPTIPNAAVPSAYVLLQDGDTSISTANNIRDARDLWGGGAGGFQASAEGQILISNDGSSFTAGVPVVNMDGIMLNGDGHIIVV